MEIVFEDPTCRISVIEDGTVMHWQVLGYYTSVQFRANVRILAEEYGRCKQKHPRLELLIDQTGLEVMDSEDTAWVASEIDPIYRAGGLKRKAFLLPENIFATLATEAYTDHRKELDKQAETTAVATEKHDFQLFTDRDEAIAWLQYRS